MTKNEQDAGSEIAKPMNAYAKYTSLGFQMIVIIGIFTYVGYKIDENAGHETQWVTAILSLTGVFISLFLVIRAVKK